MKFLTTKDVAKALDVASSTVIFYENSGQISAIRTVGGIRLFLSEEVEKFKVNRNLIRKSKMNKPSSNIDARLQR